jgi:hypothetical protein
MRVLDANNNYEFVNLQLNCSPMYRLSSVYATTSTNAAKKKKELQLFMGCGCSPGSSGAAMADHMMPATACTGAQAQLVF